MCHTCNRPDPCSCKPKKACIKDLSTNNSVYTGIGLTCSGVVTGTPLTEVLQTLDAKICDMRQEFTDGVEIVNIGTGAEFYAGESESGQKEFKTLAAGNSILITESEDEVTLDINPNWVEENIGSLIFPENIVAFDTANPNSGSPEFDPDTPTDEDALYWSSVDYTQWVYDGTDYVIAPDNPNSTPFWIGDTANDAGGNKIAPISRRGAVGVNMIGAPAEALHVGGTIRQTAVTSAILKAASTGNLVAAVAGTDYLTPTGSAAGLTSFPTFNQNTTGNAATVTTNANLTGDVTSVGNATTLSVTGVTAGSYSNVNMTVDAKGRVLLISNGGGGKALWETYTSVPTITNTLTTLFTYTLPANTLSQNGDKLEIFYAFRPAVNANIKNIYFGIGSNTYNYTLSGGKDCSLRVQVIRNTSTNCIFTVEVNDSGNAGDVTINQWTTTGWNAAQAIILQGQGVVSADISATMGYINYIPKAI